MVTGLAAKTLTDECQDLAAGPVCSQALPVLSVPNHPWPRVNEYVLIFFILSEKHTGSKTTTADLTIFTITGKDNLFNFKMAIRTCEPPGCRREIVGKDFSYTTG